jgi:hypothetical protein
MRLEHQGMSLWSATADAPAPEGTVAAGTEALVTVGVRPADVSNQVEVRYRVDQGPVRTVPATWLRNDPTRGSQYFVARLPAFQAGATVEYAIVCRCGGRQVPAPDDARAATGSFTVASSAAARLAEPTAEPTAEAAMARLAEPTTARAAGEAEEAPAETDGSTVSGQNLVQIEERSLAAALARHLVGAPAAVGSDAPGRDGDAAPARVVWVDEGDEALVHLDATAVRLVDAAVLVQVELETDQTGRAPLVVALAVGGADDMDLLATTEARARGPEALVSRWGRISQDAVWASLLAMADERTPERGLAAVGIGVMDGTLAIAYGAPLRAVP